MHTFSRRAWFDWLTLLFVAALRSIAWAACASPVLMAQSGLGALVGDHAVFQQSRPLAFSGRAAPGTEVALRLSSRSARTTCDADGKWRVELEPLEVGGPHELAIDVGTEKHVARDVWIGDVWLAGGQSNLDWPLSESASAEQAVAGARDERLRFFVVEKQFGAEREGTVRGRWVVAHPDVAAALPAVPFYFGQSLRQARNAPLGIVVSAWGGTTAEAWTDPRVLRESPRLESSWKRPARESHLQPGVLYQGMIAPLAELELCGVIFYQGESNTPVAAAYRDLFGALIGSWRANFRRPELPFLYVQLTGYGETPTAPSDSPWAALRQAQAECEDLPRTAMVPIIDLGEALDIHPKRKREVGARLALAARALSYGEKDLAWRGPTLMRCRFEGEKAELEFQDAPGGLRLREGEARDALERSFAVAGADGIWHWARARLVDGTKVELECPSVKEPRRVRYAWADFPCAPLEDAKTGLPLAPFEG